MVHGTTQLYILSVAWSSWFMTLRDKLSPTPDNASPPYVCQPVGPAGLLSQLFFPLHPHSSLPRELIESRRGSETSLRGSFYSTQETSLTDLFFTLVRLVSETDFLPLQRLVSQRSKTGQRD